MDISFTVLFFCHFVPLWISPTRINLAALDLAQWFIGVLGKKCHIFVDLASQKPKIGRIDKCTGHAHPDVNINVDHAPT